MRGRGVEAPKALFYAEVNMEKNNEQRVPYIQRMIDGRLYTVHIHFNQDAKESAQDKIKRMLLNDVRNGQY